MRKVMLLLVLVSWSGTLWAADPLIGTWKLNMAKSKMFPDEQMPRERINVYREIEGDQIEATNTIVMTDGSIVKYRTSFPKQGGTNKVLESTFPEGLSFVTTQIEAGNWCVTVLLNGKQVQVG